MGSTTPAPPWSQYLPSFTFMTDFRIRPMFNTSMSDCVAFRANLHLHAIRAATGSRVYARVSLPLASPIAFSSATVFRVTLLHAAGGFLAPFTWFRLGMKGLEPRRQQHVSYLQDLFSGGVVNTLKCGIKPHKGVEGAQGFGFFLANLAPMWRAQATILSNESKDKQLDTFKASSLPGRIDCTGRCPNSSKHNLVHGGTCQAHFTNQDGVKTEACSKHGDGRTGKHFRWM